jgi:tetratricopeptide (TPR) repeat protein
MADDTMFQAAVDALRKGDKAKAKDALTELLKSDQNNPTYWIWLSAAVDTTKERIYCLQTALQLDPENATAKRGLVLLGALPPDETVKPFSLDRPRLWEEKLGLVTDKPKEKRTLRTILASPTGRLAGFGLVGIVLIAVVVFGFILPNNNPLAPRVVKTAGPSPTFTLTPTFVNATDEASGRGTLVPLAELLDAPHTPTPFYVNTPREPQSMDNYRVVKAAYEDQDWDAVIAGMSEIARNEPNSADPYYYIGEAYRFKGDFRNALEAYNEALRIDPNFGPPYLGLARARQIQDPEANVLGLYEEALQRDPNFGEVYLDRAIFYLNDQEPEFALADLATAERLLPGSPLVYYYEARAYLALDDFEEAETAALEANAADPTMLSVYVILGEIFLENGEYAKAIDVLQTYVTYETRDANARAMIGEAYFRAGDCETAIVALSAALSMDQRQQQAYLYRGLCYVEMGEADEAVFDLERSSSDDFGPNLALMRAYMLQEHFGDAYLQGERVLSLAETNQEKALAYYWRALNFEEREEPDNAAKSWQELLSLPRSSMSSEMRAEAQEHFLDIYTLTPTTTPTNTYTPLPSFTPSRTPTSSRTPTASRTPTPTRTPTETMTPTFTKTPTPSN